MVKDPPTSSPHPLPPKHFTLYLHPSTCPNHSQPEPPPFHSRAVKPSGPSFQPGILPGRYAPPHESMGVYHVQSLPHSQSSGPLTLIPPPCPRYSHAYTPP
uniref:Uncharacterized protein n=1 Tax=Knipowitschia caucasica TaxID=637954 RepID=A0AAV2L5X8_KNICA